MRRFKILLILSILSIACIVNAHENSDNGKASLLIHIDPDDIAIAGKATTIHIDLQNSDKNFNLMKCNCVLKINQVTDNDEKEIISVPLELTKNPSVYNVEGIPFTFQSEGEYHINVTGEPKTPRLFAPFEIEILEKVLPSDTKLPVNSKDSHADSHKYPRTEIAGAGIFTIVMGYFFFSNKRPSWLQNR